MNRIIKSTIKIVLVFTLGLYVLQSLYWWNINRDVEYLKNGYETLEQIEDIIPKNNTLVLLNKSDDLDWFYSDLNRCFLLPLTLSFGYNTKYTEGVFSIDDEVVAHGLNNGMDIYVLNFSKDGTFFSDTADENFGRTIIARIDSFIEIKKHVGKNIFRNDAERYYFHLDIEKFDRFVISPSVAGAENFYTDGWTDGYGIFNNLSYQIQPNDNYLVISTYGNAPFKDDMQKLNLKVLINDIELEYIHKSGNFYYYKIANGLGLITNIKIKSSTFKPQDFGASADSRILGIDVESIYISSGLRD